MTLRKEEINRKVLHVLSGSVIPALLLYLPLYASPVSWLPVWLTPRFYPAALVAAAAAFLTVVEFMRFRVGAIQRLFYFLSNAALRPEESKRMTGATYIFYAALACSIIFVNVPSISFMVLCAFIWGDAAAALVGQSIGKTRIGTKTLEGSLGCFVLCLALFLGVFPHVPHVLDPWNGTMTPLMALVASLCIAGMELFPIPLKRNVSINDNLVVPIVTGIIIVLLFPPS
jgi:dolichol kinase